MRAELDPPLRLQRPDVSGVEQRLLDLVSIPGVGLPHVGRHKKDRSTEAVLAQQRERDGAVRAVPVVEADDDGARGQDALTAAISEVVSEADAPVAVARRPEMCSDCAARRSHPVPTGSTVTTVVVASAESSPATSQNSPTRALPRTTVEPRT